MDGRLTSSLAVIATTPSVSDLCIRANVPCDVPGCTKVLPNVSCLRMHLVRHHGKPTVDGVSSATFNPRGALAASSAEGRKRRRIDNDMGHRVNQQEDSLNTGRVIQPSPTPAACDDACDDTPAGNMVSAVKTSELRGPAGASVNTPRVFFCPVALCERSSESAGTPFVRLGHLKQHYWSMHGDRRHACGRCGATFGLASVCTRHESECGALFLCGSCGGEFATKDRLRTHAKRTKCVGYRVVRADGEVSIRPGRKGNGDDVSAKAIGLLCLASIAQTDPPRGALSTAPALPLHTINVRSAAASAVRATDASSRNMTRAQQTRETQTTADTMYEMYVAAPERSVRVGGGGVSLSDSCSQTVFRFMQAVDVGVDAGGDFGEGAADGQDNMASRGRVEQHTQSDDVFGVETAEFACGGDSPLYGGDIVGVGDAAPSVAHVGVGDSYIYADTSGGDMLTAETHVSSHSACAQATTKSSRRSVACATVEVCTDNNDDSDDNDDNCDNDSSDGVHSRNAGRGNHSIRDNLQCVDYGTQTALSSYFVSDCADGWSHAVTKVQSPPVSAPSTGMRLPSIGVQTIDLYPAFLSHATVTMETQTFEDEFDSMFADRNTQT